MTGPAIIESTPPVSQEGRHGVQDALDSVVSESVKQTMADLMPEGETPTRDETGRFVKKEEDAPLPSDHAPVSAPVVPPTVPAIPTVQSSVPVDAPAPVVMPDGFVALPKVEGRELATQFKLMDKDGELEVPDMLIEFKANGKVRTESLDKVVRLAQFGAYNEDREQAVEQSKQQVQSVQAENNQWRAYARSIESKIEHLLTSDDAYLTERAKYEQENTPEARYQKSEQLRQQEHDQHEFRNATNMGQQFYASQLVPAVDTITKALPTVSEEEIGAKLLLVSDRFKVHTRFGSIIPPTAYQAVSEALVNEVLPWAQQLHEHRESQRVTTTKQTAAEIATAKAATQKAQADSQKKTTLLTKAGKPGVGQASKDTPAPKKLVTVQDHEDAALDATMAAMGMRRAG